MHSRGINCVTRPPVCPRSENQRIFSTLGIFFYFIFFPIVLNVGKRREGALAIHKRVFLINILFTTQSIGETLRLIQIHGIWNLILLFFHHSFRLLVCKCIIFVKRSYLLKGNIPMTMWIILKCLQWIDTRTNSARGWWSATGFNRTALQESESATSTFAAGWKNLLESPPNSESRLQ